MDNHTPGPWKHDEMWGLIKYGRTEICALHSGNAANARLIAAAQELLEALEGAVFSLSMYMLDRDEDITKSVTLARAKAAIAKATKGA